MSDLQVFTNPEFGQIRVLALDGEPWAIGRDVAIALQYERPADAVRRHVDPDDKRVSKTETPRGPQDMVIINESGLYSLILSSKLPAAKRFKRWVTGEVLPTIRKTGSYTDPRAAEPRTPTPEQIIQAAAIIKDCPADRLGAVNRLLRQGGFHVTLDAAPQDTAPYDPPQAGICGAVGCGGDYSVNEAWTAEVKAKMHRFGVSNAALAQEVGVHPTYLSTVLNGHKALTDEGKQDIQERLNAALKRIEERAAHRRQPEPYRGEMTPEERDRMQYETLKKYPQMIPEYPEALERHPDLKDLLPRKSSLGYNRGFNAQKLRDLLIQRKITMGALSTASGVHRTSISDYCCGRKKPGAANRDAICKALNLSATYFDQ